jgi:hypothetical protein
MKEELEFIVPKELKELKRGSIYALKPRARLTNERTRNLQRYLHRITDRLGIEFILLPHDMKMIDGSKWEYKEIEDG